MRDPNTVLRSFIEAYNNEIFGDVPHEMAIAKFMAKSTWKNRPVLEYEQLNEIDCPYPKEIGDWEKEI